MSPSNLEVRDLQWRKARRSADNGACVEVPRQTDRSESGTPRIQDGQWLHYPALTWRNFVSGIKSE